MIAFSTENFLPIGVSRFSASAKKAFYAANPDGVWDSELNAIRPANSLIVGVTHGLSLCLKTLAAETPPGRAFGGAVKE